MSFFEQTLDKLYLLEKDARAELKGQTEELVLPKGSALFNQREGCRHYYFLSEGLVKLLFHTEDKAFIMTFFKEGSLFTELTSYYTEQPSKYTLVTIEPSRILRVEKAVIEAIKQRFHSAEALFSKLNSVATIRMMDRISEMLEASSSVRYSNFLNQHRAIMPRISLGDTANYLGITQVSLSRIRAAK